MKKSKNKLFNEIKASLISCMDLKNCKVTKIKRRNKGTSR